MRKRILFSLQISALVLFILSLAATIFQIAGSSSPLSKFDHAPAVFNKVEAFDPSLTRLNSLNTLEAYCDSVYAETAFKNTEVEFEKTYVDIVSATVRNRFYHGYSYYSFNDNYVAAIASRVTIPGLSALVIPDDILKHPFAACSQQSIVMMEVLKDKGFNTRKIVFSGKKFGGHFAFEVFYDGTWHFHDPNMEPDKTLLNSYGRPGIDFLVRNPDVLTTAYRRFPKEMILDIFPTYTYGPVNKYPAPKAIIFQEVTTFLTYTLWFFFLLAFILLRRQYLKVSLRILRDKKTNVRQIHPDGIPVYYPAYNAHSA